MSIRAAHALAKPAWTLRVAESPETRAHALSVGDTVRTGDNLYPNYEVIAISGDGAWVRDVQYGTDHVVPLATLRTISS